MTSSLSQDFQAGHAFGPLSLLYDCRLRLALDNRVTDKRPVIVNRIEKRIGR